MLVQSVVNGFGSEALAGFSAAMRIESICVVPMSAIGNAVSSYTAQNIGAQQKDRVVQGLHAASKMVIVCAAAVSYTQRDVYKRQGDHRIHSVGDCLTAGDAKKGIYEATKLAMVL